MKALVDCNSFYAACERVFQPSLHGKPVVVLSNNDGCIISRTDEAKQLGIQMAGPFYQNRKEIEDHKVAVFSSNYHLYHDMSQRVMETLRMLAPRAELYSVDESFLDLTGIDENKLHEYALFVKHCTERWTGIPVSVGIANSKLLSKVANKMAKKDKQGTGGVMILNDPRQIMEALEQTAVEDVWGVGRANAAKLRMYNIQNAWQLRNVSEEWARKNLGGVVGVRLIKELRGIPCIEMKDPLETKKMITTTRMFGKPVFEKSELKEAVATYIARAAEKLRRQKGAASRMSIFIVTHHIGPQKQYSPYSTYTSLQLPYATSLSHLFIEYAMPLVDKLYRKGNKYIKAGVIFSDIVPDNSIQFNLFEEEQNSRFNPLMKMIDNINFSMRNDIIKFARSASKRNWKMRQERRSPRYSTRWEEMKTVR